MKYSKRVKSKQFVSRDWGVLTAAVVRNRYGSFDTYELLYEAKEIGVKRLGGSISVLSAFSPRSASGLSLIRHMLDQTTLESVEYDISCALFAEITHLEHPDNAAPVV